MKTLRIVVALLVNVTLLAGVYFVLQDISSRNSYAVLLGNSPTTGYSLLTRFFTMSSANSVLSSPPTLDWVQLLILVGAILDAWLIYGAFEGRRTPALTS